MRADHITDAILFVSRAIFYISTSCLAYLFKGGDACVCVSEREKEMRVAGRVACSELMPQIVVRCRSPSATRFGQESNVIGFVQSSWQPTPADICSLLTTQTYLHQGTCTHTHAHTHARTHTCSNIKIGTCTQWFTQPHLHIFTFTHSFCGDEDISVCQ